MFDAIASILGTQGLEKMGQNLNRQRLDCGLVLSLGYFFLCFKLIFVNYRIENDCKDKIEARHTHQERKSSHGPLMGG